MALKCTHKQPGARKPVLAWIFLAAGLNLAAAGPVLALSPQKSTRLGNILYKDGHYEDAVTQYQEALNLDPESPLMNYNLGTAQYQIMNYDQARLHLQKALLTADDSLQQKAYYNLANASFRLGLEQEAADIGQAIASLEEAKSFYESALKMNDKDEDAHYNYEITRKELDRLKKKQEDQKNRQDQKDGQSGQKQDSPGQDQNGKQEKSEDRPDKKHPPQKSEQDKKSDPKPDEGQNQQQNQNDRRDRPRDQENGPDQPPEDQSGSAGQQAPGAQEQTGQGKPQAKKQYTLFTPEEARMLLNKYQNNEEPQMLFNSVLPPNAEAPVEKDW